MSGSAPLGFVEGLRWIGAGAARVWRRPLAWLVLTGAMFMIALLGALVPGIGNLILYVLSPAVLGGLLLACQQLASATPSPLAVVRERLTRVAPQLLGLGLAYTAMQVGLLLLLGAAVPGLLDGLVPGRELPATATATADALPMLLLVLLLSVPATLMMWFSPALVVFRGMGVWSAMRYSLAACIFHWRACLANGFALFALLLLASLPAMLGLIIWVPVVVGTLYSAYVDIFGAPGPLVLQGD